MAELRASDTSVPFKEPFQSSPIGWRKKSRAASTFWLWRHRIKTGVARPIRRLCEPSINGRSPKGWTAGGHCGRLRSAWESQDEKVFDLVAVESEQIVGHLTMAAWESPSQDSLC